MRVLNTLIFLLPSVLGRPVSSSAPQSPASAWGQLLGSSPITEIKGLCTSFLGFTTVTAQGATSTVTTTITNSVVLPATSINLVTQTSTSLTTDLTTQTFLTTTTQVVPTTTTQLTATTTTTTSRTTTTANFRQKRDAISSIFNKIAAANPAFVRSACLLIVRQPTTTKTLPASTKVQTESVQVTSTSVAVVQSTTIEVQPQTTQQTVSETDVITTQTTSTETDFTTSTSTQTAFATSVIGCQSSNTCANGVIYRNVCGYMVATGSPSLTQTVSNYAACSQACISNSQCIISDYNTNTRSCRFYYGSRQGVSSASGYAYTFRDTTTC